MLADVDADGAGSVNGVVSELPHLPVRRRISVFGHAPRLDDVTPANMALQLHTNVSLNRPADRTWRRPPGRPRNNWLDQLRNDSTLRPTGELWRRAVDRGHGGATTLASYATMMMIMSAVFGLRRGWRSG